MIRQALAIGVLLGALVALPVASEAPTLSEVQRLQITALLQRIELAQLKAQLAQRDFESAKAELVALTGRLQVDGYELELQPLGYKPKAK